MLPVHRVKAEEPAIDQCRMHAGDTGVQALDTGAVMDGVEKAGNQIERLTRGETAHILQRKLRFRASGQRPVQHGLVDVEPAALKSGIKKVPNVRPGPTGQIKMPFATIAKQLLQPLNATALRAVVDISAHEIVVARKVGVDGVTGHGDLRYEVAHWGRASYIGHTQINHI